MKITYTITEQDPFQHEAAEHCALAKAESYTFAFAAATMGWCDAYCSARSMGSTPEAAKSYANTNQRKLRKALGYTYP